MQLIHGEFRNHGRDRRTVVGAELRRAANPGFGCGRGTTTRLLTDLGYCVTATDYRTPPPLPAGADRVAGVDSNHFLPFHSGVFDAVDLVEKDPVQRNYNRQILSYLLDPALLLSDNIVVMARKLPDREDRISA
jgi:hypothetical protein